MVFPVRFLARATGACYAKSLEGICQCNRYCLQRPCLRPAWGLLPRRIKSMTGRALMSACRLDMDGETTTGSPRLGQVRTLTLKVRPVAHRADAKETGLIEVRRPADIPADEMQAISALVASGNEVATDALAEALARAYLIVTAKDAGRIIGTATVKTPLQGHVKQLKKLSGFRQLSKIKYEFGYDVVDPAYRGRGIYAQMRAARNASVKEPAFATVRVAKTQTLDHMMANGWVREGRTWTGRQGEVCLLCRSFVRRPFRAEVGDFLAGLTKLCAGKR